MQLAINPYPRPEEIWLQVLEGKSGQVTGLNPVLPLILSKTWGWPVLHLFITWQGKIVALLAFLKVGKRWVSLPHFDQGAVWFDHEFVGDQHIANEMLHQTVVLALQQAEKQMPFDRLNIEVPLQTTATAVTKPDTQLLLRCTRIFSNYSDAGKVITEIELISKAGKTYQMPAGPARKVRRAQKYGLQIRRGGIEILKDFYTVYRRNIAALGSVGMPLIFFENLITLYRNGIARVYVCYDRQRPVGSCILLTYGGYAENLWFATNRSVNHKYPAYLLHQAMIEDALSAECSFYSMGRSTAGGGVHRFKQQFGGSDNILYYNATPAIHNSGSKELLKNIIRLIPYQIAMRFDRFAGTRFY